MRAGKPVREGAAYDDQRAKSQRPRAFATLVRSAHRVHARAMSQLVANADAAEVLRAFGLTYPGVHLKSPWPGHLDLAVKDKTFVYLSVEGEPFKISCKLPFTHEGALEDEFCTPTPYGLGRAGWVTARPPGKIDIDRFKDWIDESYRAQAPKSLLKQLIARG
jgi:hypothetical protein